MSRPRLIGVAGPAGAGKSTTAVLLGEHGFTQLAFADPMKRVAKNILGFSDEQLWGPSEQRNVPDRRFPREKHVFPVYRSGEHCECCGIMFEDFTRGQIPCYLTPRYALRLLGTEWGRHCYENIWVDKTLQLAREVLARELLAFPDARVVVSDVRFENEAAAIREAGGVIWFKTPNPHRQERRETHGSEAGIKAAALDQIVPWTEDSTKLVLAIEALLVEAEKRICEKDDDRRPANRRL